MLNKLKPAAFKALDLSLILGVGATVAFYSVMHQPALHGTLLHRYTTAHPVDYVIVTLFMWGIVDILLKLLSFPKESLALREQWLPPKTVREPVSNARELLAQVDSRPKWLAESRIGLRFGHALDFIVENGSAQEIRDHLQYLSDQAEETTHGRYTLVRFVIAVTPVLGFLGTVVHFGTALSGISFAEMTERLPMVVSEMGEAFNTTTVALAAAMSMMFSLFMCERVEHSYDRSVDRMVERELLNRFEVKHQDLVPFLSIVQAANEEVLRVMAGTLERQVSLWTESLQTIFQRFDDRQQIEGASLAGVIEQLDRRHQELDNRSEGRVAQLLAQIDARQDAHLSKLEKTLQSVVLLRDDFKEIGKTFQNLTQGEGRLLELQQVLNENLRTIHQTQHFDEALHGLTAAIHLMTARNRLTGGYESAAA